MPRKKAKPTIKDQLRAIIAQALEEGQLDLAKSLIEVIRAMGTPGHKPIAIDGPEINEMNR